VLCDEGGEADGWLTADFFDEVVGAGKDSVLEVDGDFVKVLPEELSEVRSVFLCEFCERRGVGELIANRLSDDVANLFGYLGEGVFFGADEGIDFADVVCRRDEDVGDDARLIFGSDEGDAAFSEGQRKDACRFDEAAPVEYPLSEECGAKVDGGDAGPVEDSFGEPVILSGVAGCFAPGRCLRHVYDGLDARFFGCLGEVCRGFKDAGLDGKDEVGAARAFESSADRFEVAEVSKDDLRALLAKRFGTIVVGSHHGAYGLATLEEEFDGIFSGFSGRSGY